MFKYLFIAFTFVAIFHTPTMAVEHYKGVRVFVDPPETPYAELGLIEHQQKLEGPENVVAFTVGETLKRKASKLGGNAFIVKAIIRFPAVHTKSVSDKDDPFLYEEGLTMFIKIEAMAIKLNQ